MKEQPRPGNAGCAGGRKNLIVLAGLLALVLIGNSVIVIVLFHGVALASRRG